MRNINLDNVKEMDGSDTFEKLLGGYVCKIMKVTDVPEREYLKIEYTVAEGDSKDFKYSWGYPNFVKSYKEGLAQSFFKGFITAVEESNPNYKFAFDEQTLVGKLVGLVIGQEEYINDKGDVKVSDSVKQTLSTKRIRENDYKMPELKKIPVPQQSEPNPFQTETTTPTLTVEDTDEIPF